MEMIEYATPNLGLQSTTAARPTVPAPSPHAGARETARIAAVQVVEYGTWRFLVEIDHAAAKKRFRAETGRDEDPIQAGQTGRVPAVDGVTFTIEKVSGNHVIAVSRSLRAYQVTSGLAVELDHFDDRRARAARNKRNGKFEHDVPGFLGRLPPVRPDERAYVIVRFEPAFLPKEAKLFIPGISSHYWLRPTDEVSGVTRLDSRGVEAAQQARRKVLINPTEAAKGGSR
jgi:hypothetical protein